MIKNIIAALTFAFVLSKSGFVYAEGSYGSSGMATTGSAIELSFGQGRDVSGDSGISNKLLNFIYGRSVKNGLMHLPFGMHTKPKKRKLLTMAYLELFIIH